MKKSVAKEIKIGVVFIVAVAMAYTGINFLKGINIFKPTNHYFATYENVNGLLVSNSVYIKGYKVGQVREITYDFAKERPFTVQIAIENDLKLPAGTVLRLYDENIMGGKALELVLSDTKETFQNSGDTLASDIQAGLLSMIGELAPKLESTINHADSLIVSVNEIASSKELKNSLTSLESTTNDLRATSAKLKILMNQQVPTLINNVNDVCGDLKVVSGNLKTVDIAALAARIDNTVANLQNFSEKLNNNDGTLSLLMNDKALYQNLSSATANANLLLIDLKENPKRYVHFSLFGQREKKEKK